MPYHPDSATRDLFIRDYIHTPTTLSQVVCSICRQRCTRRHPAVQISGHPQCQCMFGKTCLLQWLESGSAASNTCPSCKAVLYNANCDELDGEVDEGTESDNNDGGEDELTIPTRGRPKCNQGMQAQRRRRSRAPSPSPSRSSASSTNEALSHTYNLRPRPVPSPPSSSTPSPPPQAPLTHPLRSSPSTTTLPALLHTLAHDLTITTLVDDLWTDTWDLVAESRELTPDNAPRSRSITRAQLIMLVLDVWPFGGEVQPAVLEHLVLRARKMVQKHRNGYGNGNGDGGFDAEAELRLEREDVRLAVGYGV
ncbi:hypothetical protein PTMSG1_07284 [Pyrenophora teres f. maculata]|nr:hypothetical protein PTMSG1_07284 [Pyrenophora teres f. maculata]